MKKEKLEKLAKNVGELKDKATKISQEAVKGAGVVKGAIQTGVEQSKGLIEKASKVVNRNAIGSGIEATSKGVELVAKGAKIASKSVDSIAKTMEKASSGIRELGGKIKKDRNPQG